MSCKEQKPNTWNAFQKNSKGVFTDSSQASQGYQLWKDQNWTELETLLGPGSWPPNRGFVSIEKETLQPGVRIDRFGGFHGSDGTFKDFGAFVSPEGNSFTSRALPAATKSKPYNAYEIVSAVEVNSGPAIPWFGEAGMGTQYELPKSISILKSENAITSVTPKNSAGDL